MSPKLFVALLVLLAALYLSGVGMSAFGGDEPAGSTAPRSTFVEDVLGDLLAPLRDPLPLGDLHLDIGLFATSPGVSFTAGRIVVPAGDEPRFVRLRIKSNPAGGRDQVRCADLVLVPPAAPGAPAEVQSRYWDVAQKQPSADVRPGWDRSPPATFDPQALREAADEDPYPIAAPSADEPLRLAVRRDGGVLDLCVRTTAAVTLEFRS